MRRHFPGGVSICSFLLCLCIALSLSALAQTSDRITEPIDDAATVRLQRSTHPALAEATDLGRVEKSVPLERIVLMLKPSVEQQEALSKFLDDVHDRNSPRYQHWLSPEEFAARFGPSDSDTRKINDWLLSKGFKVDQVARGKQWIQFSGTTAEVESAFQTEMHRYSFHGEQHIANSQDIALPAAFSGVVRGILSLHDFHPQPLHTALRQAKRDPISGELRVVDEQREPASPYLTTSRGAHLLAPGDWARIYNTQPLLDAGVSGSGITIAVVGSETSVQLSDIRTFRKIFNLPENDPDIIFDGTDPGIQVGNSFEVEAALDIEWSGAIAPNAKIKFVTASSTLASFGFQLAIAHVVDNRLAPITTISIGSCEFFLGDSGNAFLNQVYQQAAAEGITIVVAAGDTGAAGCDGQVEGSPAFLGPQVNGSASTPYDIAVGGNMFVETAGGTFWNATNRPDHSSVIGYIPETVWQETCDPSKDPNHCGDGFYYLSAGSGGPSSCIRSSPTGAKGYTCYAGYPKPAWQTGIGVPADGVRDLPDVSLTAGSGHDGYLVCVEGSCQTSTSGGKTLITNASVIGGTSAGAPSLAGALALLEQKKQPYLGLINYNLYKLAAAESLTDCNSSSLIDPTKPSACIFYDVTTGNNNVPGQTGARAVRGFDLASGLGSINFANLVSSWDSIKKIVSVATLHTSSSGAFKHGQGIPITVAVKPASGTGVPTGSFVLIANNGKAFPGGSLTNGAFTGSVNDLPAGTYQVTARYGGDATFAASVSAPITVQIAAEDTVTTAQPIALEIGSGVPYPLTDPVGYDDSFGLQVTVTGKSAVGQPTGLFTIVMDGKKTYGPFSINAAGNAFIWLSTIEGKGIPPGKHSFVVSYAGDATFHPSVAAPASIIVQKGFAAAFVFVAQEGAYVDPNINSIYAGLPINVLVSLQPLERPSLGILPPTGSVRLYECSDSSCSSSKALSGVTPVTQQGPSAIPSSQALFTIQLPAGFHILEATYSGDSYYVDDPLGGLQRSYISVSPAPPVLLSLTQAPGIVPLGHIQRFDLAVKSAKISNGVVRGTAYLIDGSGSLATDPVPVNNGVATFLLPQMRSGPNMYWALFYAGGADGIQVASPAVITNVSQGTTSTAVSPSSLTVLPNVATDITATVLGSVANAVLPQAGYDGGQVVYYDSLNGAPATVLAGPQILTGGDGANASVNTIKVVLAAGTHQITAKFLGTRNWTPSTSAGATIVVRKSSVGQDADRLARVSR